MSLQALGPVGPGRPLLVATEMPRPIPEADEILIEIAACGVCHTEIDEIEGRTAPPRLPVVPGHQVVGRVAEAGPGASRFKAGDRVGVGWIFGSDGSASENLSERFLATGRDADGGYAEFMKIGERYAFPIPGVFSDEQAAPLLCAGSVGFRALRLAKLENGEPLGLMGFGGSGHIVLQLARHLYPQSQIGVFARSEKTRRFALESGANWAAGIEEPPPVLLRAVIDTTPAWRPVVAALAALAPGGRLVINAIRKEDGDRQLLADIDYARHLWLEKELKTVANVTAADIADFLDVAAAIPVRPQVSCYPLHEADAALCRLKAGKIRGSLVLKIK